MSFTFPKEEKLKSRKTIELLFLKGKSLKKFPVRLNFLPLNESLVSQAGFVVPKKNFKSAVDRNRIKRQLKEAYRLHKHLLNDFSEVKYALLFIYIGSEKKSFKSIEKAVITLLTTLKENKK
jgi:ribonuclease P protein component